MKIVVVGGGVVGCAITFRLATRGHDVVLLERGRPGDGATAASAGMIAPQAEADGNSPLLSLGLVSRCLYSRWVAELRDITSMDMGFAASGLVLTALDETERRAQARRRRWQQEQGLAVERLDRAGLLELAGPLNPAATEGLFFPDECHVHPRQLSLALAAGAARHGAEVRPGTRVVGLTGTAQRVTGVVTDQGEEHGDVVVLAAGCWTHEIATEIGDVPRGEPVRGQIVELEPALPRNGPLLYTDVGYLVPRGSRFLFGATTEYVGFRSEVTADGVRGLLDALRRLCPGLGDAVFASASAGLRPESPDGLPTIGPSEMSGLLVATGHYRNGVLLAPVTAEIVADLIDDRLPRPEIEPFLPGRHRSDAPLRAR